MLKHFAIYGRFLGKPISADELFCDLPLKTKQSLASLKQTKKVLKGEIVTQIGSFSSFIYLLQNGKAQMSLKNNLGMKKNIRLVEKKEIIGLKHLFANAPGEMFLETLSPCDFEIIKQTDFIEFLKNEPQICFRLASLLSLNIQLSYETFSNSNY